MFKNNDKVKMKDHDRYVYGFITIAKDDTSKVLFEFPESELDYYYYDNTELELVSDEEYNKLKKEYNSSHF